MKINELKVGKLYKTSTGNARYKKDENDLLKCTDGEGCWASKLLYNEAIEMNFEEVKQPVSYEKVLNTNKKVRFEHEFLKEEDIRSYTEIVVNNCFIELYLKGEFLEFNIMMLIILLTLDSDESKTALKTGKWYIED